MVIGTFSKKNASVFIDHEEMELVDSFKYIGSSMSSLGDIHHEISCHIGKASAASNQLRKIWKNQKLILIMKVCLYRTNVLLTLLYGSRTWQLMTGQEKKFNVFNIKCLCQTISDKLTDFVPNAEIKKYINQPPVSWLTCHQCLIWLRHVARLPPSRLAKQVLE